MALVQTGYYTGTGERVKQKINVGFNLKFLCISLLTSKVGSSGVKALIAAGNALSYCCIYPYGTSGNCSGYVASYPDSAENEFAVENDLNISGAKYFYIAIG